jgi:hypothetical protein
MVLAKPVKNKATGTAYIAATVNGPGTITLTGDGLVTKEKTAKVAGQQVKLNVKTSGNLKERLRDKGRVAVTVLVTFTPTNGSAVSKTRTVHLVKK